MCEKSRVARSGSLRYCGGCKNFDTVPLPPPPPQMAISDYEADATELLETYGAPRLVLLKDIVELSRVARFSNEIYHHRSATNISPTPFSTNLCLQVKLEQANLVSCTISHTTPVRTAGRSSNASWFTRFQSRNILNTQSEWSFQAGQ
jgi:hypothetical protein